MTKEEVATAIGGLEAWGRTVDNWVLICAIGVAVFLAAEAVFSVMHWRNENKLRPLRAAQERLHQEEISRLNRDAERLRHANLVLQKAGEPRRIVLFSRQIGQIDDRDKRSKFIEVMHQFPGTNVFIQFAPEFEAQVLAGDIVHVVKRADWNPIVISEAQSHISPGLFNTSWGVQIFTLEESMFVDGALTADKAAANPFKPGYQFSKLSEGARALANFLALDLNEISLDGVIWGPEYSDPRQRKFPSFHFPPNSILVLVGPKPAPHSVGLEEPAHTPAAAKP